MNNEYVALLSYAGVTFIAFVGGLLWMKYRRAIKRHLQLKHYHDSGDESHA